MSLRSILKSIFQAARCPHCGAYNSYDAKGRCIACHAVRSLFPDENPTLRARRQAEEWWRANPDCRTGACDRCSQVVERGEGYLVTPGVFGGSDLLCESCWHALVPNCCDTAPEEHASE